MTTGGAGTHSGITIRGPTAGLVFLYRVLNEPKSNVLASVLVFRADLDFLSTTVESYPPVRWSRPRRRMMNIDGKDCIDYMCAADLNLFIPR